MVKVSIRDYMPPYTSWMQVELEDGVCNASPKIVNPDEDKQGYVDKQEVNTNFAYDLNPGTGDYGWDK